MRVDEFWQLSVGQVMDALEAYADRRIAEQRERASICYTLAQLTGIAFNDPKRFPDRRAVFPRLFEREEAEDVPEWKRQQAGMAAWVAAYNEKRRREAKR